MTSKSTTPTRRPIVIHFWKKPLPSVRCLPLTTFKKIKRRKKDAKTDPSIELLTAIEKDGMLECWILFDNPDQGIAQDYVAYRKEHRDLMHRYIEKYEIHLM